MKSVLQTITIAGQPCAIVPLAEYHALREALEDAADNATLVRLRAGNAGEEATPAALSDRIPDGESPVRVRRGFRSSTSVAGPSAAERL